MKIIELKAENVKRITAVHIKPPGDVVQISGKNEQGKSSVLDSIWYALGGPAAFDRQPIRSGADEASIYLDLGDIKVTRKIKAKEGGVTASLLVENADGTRPKSPQHLLDDLVGRFSLDPLAFSRMSAKDQFDALKSLVPGYDFDGMAKANADDYERRTAENRRAKEAKAAAQALDVPDRQIIPIDEGPILADIARAGEHNSEIEARKRRRFDAERQIATLQDEVKTLEKLVMDHQRQIEELRGNIMAAQARAQEAREQAHGLARKLQEAPPLPEPLDTVKLSDALSAARAVNLAAGKQAQRDALLREAMDREAKSQALTQAMAEREAAKVVAIEAAKLPVAGLTLGDGEVLVDGLPFSQAAASRKIRISVALAMALNPKIRVIRIMDGSLLDSDAMDSIRQMAIDHDCQVWIETVQHGDGAGVIIEDGHVKEE